MKNTVDLGKFVPDRRISASDHSFKKAIWFFISAFFFQSKCFPFSFIKVFLLRVFGAEIGQKVNIKPQVYIKYPWNLKLGNNVWIGELVWIANESMVSIGNNVCLSHGALILCGGHDYKKTHFDVYNYPVIIEDGAWMGAQSALLGGNTMGSHAVLAIKSVASTDLESYSINRGNPAVKVKDRVISNE